MPANSDFREMFSAFNAENVEYLVVDAHAVIYYTEPRYTKDLDIWVNPTAENAKRVYEALKRFGAPLDDVTHSSLTDPESVFQIGVAPNRIDIMMGIAGVDFSSAWTGRVDTTYDDIPIHILGKVQLIQTKRATGRPQDLLDIQRLT